jgi:hypothetical protein
MTAAEPAASLGTSILAALALATVADTTRTRGGTTVLVVVVLTVRAAIAVRSVRVAVPSARAIWSAWLSWTIEVGRGAALALLAMRIVRATAQPSKDTEAKPEGPYRAAGEGAPTPEVPNVVPAVSASALPALRSAAGALSIYRVGFLVRVGTAVFTTLVALLLTTSRGRDGVVLFMMGPLTDLATAIVLLVALVKLLGMRRAFGTLRATIGAIVALSVCGLTDCATLAFEIDAMTSSSYRAFRESSEVLALHFPATLVAGGVSLLFVASVLRRTGEGLGGRSLEDRARWVQALVVAAGTAQLGFFNVFLAMSERRQGMDAQAGGFVAAAFVLFGASASVAVVVLMTLLVSAVRRARMARVQDSATAP